VVIAVAVPSFFAGMGGMSELTTVTGITNPLLADGAFLCAMALLGTFTFMLIKRLEKH